MSFEEQITERIGKAFSEAPIALDYAVLGKEALTPENLAANFGSIVAYLLPALTDCLTLLAKEVDALAAAIQSGDDKPTAG